LIRAGRYSFSTFVPILKMQTEPLKDGSRRLRSSYLSAIVSISLVLWMLGLLGLLVIDSRKISNYLKEHVELNIFLRDNISEKDLAQFQQEIGALPFVHSARYITKEEALDSLKKDLGEGAVSMLESNPLPASIDIHLNADYTEPDSLKNIKTALEQIPLVREVSYQQTEVKRMNDNFRTVALVILVFCCLLFFIAVALINNTIRLSLYSKRFLIKSMQLVGATKGFIRKPFLKKGFVHGLYAGILSCILLGGVIYLIHSRFPELEQLSDFNLLITLFGLIVLFGIILSGISTFFAVNRYLKLRSEELYN
jgi:cell division transport system permease protein